MESTVPSTFLIASPDNVHQAWQMVLSQLRMEMSRVDFENWVQPLQPLDYRDGVFYVGAVSPYARDWVNDRLKSRITHILEGMLNATLTLEVQVVNAYYRPAADQRPAAPSAPPPAPSALAEESKPEPRSRKVMLQRAYGSKRAAIIQPDRTLLVTQYFFFNWLPILGHSAMAVIMAARSMCYWNPMTGQLRNTVETEMGELARKASVSVRTVKDVMKNEDVQKYFLRYKVRRVVTENGVRTAGIVMQVRMDDPLTPKDQQEHNLVEEEVWYSPEFEDPLQE
ncbi:MAG: hypothetical protein HPY45_13990 [Anaerolineae bacterium]|nr:hypothetical protein [Anaerolineae bacterium]